MNILIYFSKPLNPYSGGTERVAFIISNYFKSQGHNIFNMACVNSDESSCAGIGLLPDGSEEPTRKNISYLNEFISSNNIDVIINESGNSNAIFLFSHEHIDAKVRIITHLHFDIYGDIKHFYNSLNLPLLGVGLKLAVINLMKWIKSPYNKRCALRWKKRRYEYMYRNSDYIVVLTEQHVIDFCNLINAERSKIMAISNPIEHETRQGLLECKSNYIMFIGRLDYPKRIDRVLKVWKLIQDRHREWTMQILGDGPDMNRLRRLSIKLGLKRINFIGRTNPQEYYSESKILLLTSNYEGTPMVITEAMSYGVVPIVMNSFPSAAGMITNNKDGILIPPFNIEYMGEICDILMNDTETWLKLSRNAVDKISAFSNSAVMFKWNSIISK